MRLKIGDCLEQMKLLESNSIDAIVTDPPYGLKFMNKGWDYELPNTDTWREVVRVLKPGGHLLAFGGTRTYHRLAVAIEDAGFEIRDQIQWIYGSGFPKSLDISKAIDKAAGIERENGELKFKAGTQLGVINDDSWKPKDVYETAPSTDLAKQWQGFGTALKPANEPIVLARKPLSEKTVAANVLKWGTGGLNIDACRIPHNEKCKMMAAQTNKEVMTGGGKYGQAGRHEAVLELKPNGRFPANLIFDEEAARMLDEQSGNLKSGKLLTHHQRKGNAPIGTFQIRDRTGEECNFGGDSGGASRFFYVAKASKRERNQGLDTTSSNHR